MSDSEQTLNEQSGSLPGAKPAPEGEAPADRPAGRATNADPDNASAPGAGHLDGDAAEVQGDLDELVKTAAQRDESLALAQRTQADFENYRKRVARDSASAQARGCILLAKELLPALDNLDRALEEASSTARPAGVPGAQ